MDFIKNIHSEYYLYSAIGILLLGIILGFTRTITVYRDFADLTKIFMLVLAPVGLLIIFGNFAESKLYRNIILIIESILIIWIFISTLIDNRNIFKTLLAFIVKIPLGIIFAIYLIALISPGGKNYSQRRKNRGIAGIVLIFLAPILYGLVRNRVWSYKNEK